MNLMLRVALFLRDEASQAYDLIPSDIAILLILASHLGERDYWYISQKQIANECRLQSRQFYARAKKLETQKLISIKRTGKANAYGLNLPNIVDKSWYVDQHSTADHEKDDQHSTADQISTTMPIRSALECRHKETINKQKETERARTRRAPTLPLDFWPDEQSIKLGKELGFDAEIIHAFKDFCSDRKITSNDFQARFRKYLRDEIKFKGEPKKAAVEPSRYAKEEYVPPYQDIPVNLNGAQTVNEVLVKLTGRGSLLNGLGKEKGNKTD